MYCVWSIAFEQNGHLNLRSLSTYPGHLFEQLPLLHERVSHAAGLAPELDEPPVVDDAIDHCRRHLVVAEQRVPPAELQVRGDDPCLVKPDFRF